MNGTSKTVEEATLDTTVLEQLTDIFQCIHRVLYGLGWETIHQIGMHQNTGVSKAACYLRHLLDGYALLHELE